MKVTLHIFIEAFLTTFLLYSHELQTFFPKYTTNFHCVYPKNIDIDDELSIYKFCLFIYFILFILFIYLFIF